MSLRDPLYVLVILLLLVVLAEYISRGKWGRKLGAAMIVILLGAIASNAELIPGATDSISLYDGIFTYIAPLGIFYLLLGVNLGKLKDAGLPMLIIFLLGSVATLIGVIGSGFLWNSSESLGDEFRVIAGMFTGTYTGGSVNFNAVALSYSFQDNPLLFAGAVAIDNVVTAIWMMVTLIVPTIRRKSKKDKVGSIDPGLKLKTLSLTSFMLLIFMGVGTLWLSGFLSDTSANLFGFRVPDILILTSIALGLAQLPIVQKLRGSEILGLYTIYLFLVVIGAYCEFGALGALADIGVALAVFTFTAVAIHGLLIYGIGLLITRDLVIISVASQANIGGGTTAMAIAETHGRNELILPAILVGSLGNAIGTYMGFMVVGIF